jgi:hypothetical protein
VINILAVLFLIASRLMLRAAKTYGLLANIPHFIIHDYSVIHTKEVTGNTG